MSTQLFSPKQVARAFGVSESSLKRWCDRGLIGTVRTAGGHRRIALPEIMRFARTQSQSLTHPEALGLPSLTRAGDRVRRGASEHLLRSLVRGDELACRRMVVELYLAGDSLAAICDDVLAPVMNRVGDLWQCGDLHVYQERFGCEICRRILDDCREFLPHASDNSPVAVGGTPTDDPYSLPTRMAELVLREAGWQAVSLGTNLPFQTLAAAVHDKRASLVWLSLSSPVDSRTFAGDFRAFCAGLPAHVRVVLGGRALTSELRRVLGSVVYCDNMRQLVDDGTKFKAQLRETISV